MSETKLNFNKTSINYFWKQSDQRVSKAISIMENVEHWVVDDVESVAKELIGLGKKMSEVSKESLNENAEELIFIMAYISCGKALRLLNWIDESYPSLSFYYVMNARQTVEDSDQARLLIDRLQTIKTLSMLGKIFSPSRTRLISELLKEKGTD